MSRAAIIDTTTGRIDRIVVGPLEQLALNVKADELLVEITDDVVDDRYRWDGTKMVRLPPS